MLSRARLGGTWPEVQWVRNHGPTVIMTMTIDDGDEKSELAGAAEEGASEVVVSGSVGEGHLGLEGAVDHLDHLQRDAGDGAGDAEDDDGDGAESVADGEERSLKAEGVAEGKAHEGDGGTGEFANLGEAGVAPSVVDPGDVAANEDAEG